ncbi:MAG: helix-turn-helix protein [Candidatus Izimaplasma bacterium HR2]|nr:MAG: helix-turn-helix protein [Candidatus Izimaplasma bacterium HR2]
MLNIDSFEKDNLKVLGLLVRYKRILLGYSLRDLGEITKISHTLISNFERGIMIPHNDTIKDIFDVLELEFYDDPLISVEFVEIYNKTFKHILYYEYEEAEELVREIEKKRHIYENSKEVINFTIIRCLFYVLTNTFIAEKDKVLKQYEVVLDFFSDNQKQLFYFIKGLDKLNQEFYKESRDYFEKALKIGNHNIDLLINEHYVISLSKSNNFVDSRSIADKCIVEYEKQTNYVRAMRLRTRIAQDYIRLLKFEDAKKMYSYVYDYSIKYNIKDLENRCNTRFAMIAVFENDFELAEEYLSKVTPVYAKIYYYLKFDILVHKREEKELLKYYDKVMSEKWVKEHPKSENFFKLILMRYSDKYMDKKEYEKLLANQIDMALKSDDAEMLEVSSKFLVKFYKSERQYKKGLVVCERFLHYIRYGVQ